jgi:DNA-directed RNA polymerase subunit RPC12/RpoP
MTLGIYDSPYSCNKCGKENDVKGDPFHPEASGEVETKCKECGFEDHWSFGFFESGQDGLNASGKY